MRKWWLILFVLLCLIGLWRQFSRQSTVPEETQKLNAATIISRLAAPQPPLPGEEILSGYALPGTRPQEDLSMVAHALSNLLLLIKGDAPFMMGANEEFAAALRGKTAFGYGSCQISIPALMPLSQLVDCWRSPLFFHVINHSRLDIRNAGPDRQMWTEDDLHRRYDCTYLHGSDLNPSSLHQTTDGKP